MNDIRFFRNLLILNGALPLAILAVDAWRGQLGVNAVNEALHITGILSLVFLTLALCVTPLKWWTGWHSLTAYRRALGLFGFWYAVVHLGLYVVFDRAGRLSSVVDEILQRRYLQVGCAALLLMLPLAVTSTNAMIAWLQPARWKLLHRAAYLATALGVLHYYWLVKSDVRAPLGFALVLGGLLGLRLVQHYLELRAIARTARTAPPASVAASAPSGQPVRAKPFRGPLRVAGIFAETPEIKTFRLAPVAGGELPFNHLAGQFLTLSVTLDGRVHRRCYTIASSPARRAYVEISVKREPQGTVSRYLHDSVREGDLLEIAAPGGKFFIEPAGRRAVVLIGGGVGMTPVMSMLRFLLDTSWPGVVHLLQVARREADLLYDEELSYLARRHPNLRRTIALTAEPASRPSGVSGRLTAALLRERVPLIAAHAVYLCGPQAMMDHTVGLLAELGVPGEAIHTEAFASKQPLVALAAHVASDAASARASDDNVPAETVAITFARSGVEAAAGPSRTLLETAEDAGVTLNWECRSGVCGQCRVRCLSGTVRHDSEDALTAADKSSGYVLACQARPLTAVVVEA